MSFAMIQVLKFGGSSVADATNISRVLDIVSAALSSGRVLLVTSAVSGCTDALIEAGRSRGGERERIIAQLQQRHLSIINRLFTGAERRSCAEEVNALFEDLRSCGGEVPPETFGEIFSTTIIARKLACEGIQTLWLDSRHLIATDEEGKVDTDATYKRIGNAVQAHPEVQVFVTPGFVAGDAKGRPTTLGRGGSDYSAALFAAAIGAGNFEIWTDVPGIMTTNPKDVPEARTIPCISYGAALDMAAHGAKVLYAPAVQPVMEKGIAFRIKDCFNPSHPGTLVGAPAEDQVEVWKGVARSETGVPGQAQICLVGENISSPDAAERRIISSLGEVGISPCGEIGRTPRGSLLIPVRDTVAKEALAAVHREFFEDSTPVVKDIYIAGFGAVGSELASMIGRSSVRIARRSGRRIRIVGIADSTHFVLDASGIEPESARELLKCGSNATRESYVDSVIAVAGRKSIFVDCTDSPDLHLRYPDLLRAGISIVTSNRRSVAVLYAQYASYKALARENGVFFRYDTSVGAALPILESIAGEANCSDRIVSIEAVVSCTLNYIISSYNGAKKDSMATLLRKAQQAGLTEKDPRADIGGQDALRKLLILGREAGIPLEEKDVLVTPMLGPEFFGCSLEEFYRRLAQYEQVFVRREADLDSRGMRQRFVASIRRDKAAPHGYRAEIKMQEVAPDSPFWSVSGTQNVTVISSEYSEPLVIKGAGEGAALAASGIIKDILL